MKPATGPRPKQGSSATPRCMGRTALSMPRSRSRQQIRPHRRQRSHQLQPLTCLVTSRRQMKPATGPRPKQGSSATPRCMGRTALSMPRWRRSPNSRNRVNHRRKPRGSRPTSSARRRRRRNARSSGAFEADAEARKQRNPEMHGENSPEHAPVAKPSTDQAAPAPKKPSAPAVDPLGDITPADEARYRAEAEAKHATPRCMGRTALSMPRWRRSPNSRNRVNHRRKPRGSRPTSSARRRRRRNAGAGGGAFEADAEARKHATPRCMGRTALSMPRSRSRQQIRPHRRQRSHQLQPLTRSVTSRRQMKPATGPRPKQGSKRNPEMHGEQP